MTSPLRRGTGRCQPGWCEHRLCWASGPRPKGPEVHIYSRGTRYSIDTVDTDVITSGRHFAEGSYYDQEFVEVDKWARFGRITDHLIPDLTEGGRIRHYCPDAEPRVR